MAVTRADVITCARGFVGVQYAHQGRSRAGLDCVGLLIVVARELGLADIHYTAYGREPRPVEMIQLLEAHLDRRHLLDARPGDLLLLDLPVPCHLGILGRHAGHETLIHAALRYGRVVEHGYDAGWVQKTRRAFAYRGLA
jgi:cell wall-associated NlpC family hydrolase